MKLFHVLLAALLVFAPISGYAQAKPSGGGFGVSKPSSSSNSSAPRPSSNSSGFGVSKPTSSPAVAPPQTKQSVSPFGVSKPNTPTTNTTNNTTRTPADTTSRAAARDQSKSAFSSFTTSQNKQYTRPPQPVNPAQARSNTTFSSVENRYRTNGRFDRLSYTTAYNRDITHITVIPASRYVYINAGPPNYGIWNALTFWALLGATMEISASNAAWAAQHQNDAEYRAWRAEANERATQDANLKAQLAALDAKISTLQPNQPAPKFPEGISETVAISPIAIAADNPDDDDDSSIWSGIVSVFETLCTIGFFLLVYLAWQAHRRRNAY